MTKKQPKYGLQIEEKLTDYILGGGKVPFEVLRPDGNWEPSLPKKEFQNLNAIEPYACVPFTILNCLETLIKRKYGVEENYSDRFLAAIVNTRNGGTTYQKACDALRAFGVPPEEVWPFSPDIDTTDKFFAPPNEAVMQIAKELNEKYDFRYERVPSTHEAITHSLTSSPLLFSVYAWVEKDGIYYRPEGQTDIHATTLFYQRPEVFRRMFDSYDSPHLKDYRWSDLPMVCVRFWIEKRNPKVEQLKKTLLDTIMETLKRIGELLGLIQVQVNEIPKVPETKPIAPPPVVKYKWNFPSDVMASIRLIAAEEGVDANLAVDVARCESNFKVKAFRQNTDKHKSKDRGLYQWNNYWFPAITDTMAYNPEKATRLFCKEVKRGGLINWKWSAKCWNKGGKYDKYLKGRN